MSVLFKIGDNDYTNHITVPSYKVNREKEEEEWVDVTKTKHKEIVRTTVRGDFDIYFDDINELYAFLDDIENNTTTKTRLVTKTRTVIKQKYNNWKLCSCICI